MAGENHESRLADVLIVSFDDGPGSVRDQDQLLTGAVDRLRKVAGVESATVFAVLPFQGLHRPPISVPGVGEPRLDGELPFMIESTPESFDILGIDVVQGEVGGKKFEVPTIREALQKYFDDAEARHLAPTTIRKRRELLEGKLLPYCETRGFTRA